MENNAEIKEFFTSIQGEGLFVGVKQLFVRFAKCNLNCQYCDTNYENGEIYNKHAFFRKLKSTDTKNIHSISLTGGEPLLYTDFLVEILPDLEFKIYLETNGTLFNNYKKIAKYIDYLALDLKIESATGEKSNINECEFFLQIAQQNKKVAFLKVVFDKNITDQEIKSATQLADKYKIKLIFQPMMKNKKTVIKAEDIKKVLYKALDCYNDCVVIPQTHNFLDIE